MNRINKIICFSIFGLLLSTCELTQGEEYIPPGLVLSKPSKKELAYVEMLRKRGYSQIELSIPTPGYDIKGHATYLIRMDCPFNLTNDNKDSIDQINQDIATHLYSTVIEDSIIVEMGQLNVDFHVKKSDLKQSYQILFHSYFKKELEKLTGFRVITISNNLYKRELLR